MKLPSATSYAFWMAIFRLYVGAFWLMHGIPKWTQSASFMPPNGLMTQFLNAQISNTIGPYQWFLTTVVLPNAWFFADMVRTGEVVTGLLLFFGLFSRWGGVIGVLLSLNYLSASGGLAHLRYWDTINSAALVLSLMNVVLPTGLVFGIDGLLARRKTANAPAKAVFVDEPPMTGPTAPSA
ncbi:MAG TPA: TQO small subunit DoxD [Candidatus Baltobacteraceae bacterium]|nr:TQO small subunit DoxD [Candidatus Baltobacteraceae bacterium]